MSTPPSPPILPILPIPPIPPVARRVLAEPRFAVVATTDPNGGPHQVVAWFRLEGDEIVLNSAEGRRWPRNLRRDPRIHFLVADAYQWIRIAGTVRVIDDQAIAQADIAEMARRYHADDPAKAEKLIHDQFSGQHRVSFRFRPSRIAVSWQED